MQIVREGLTNIVRHAGARSARVFVNASNGELRVVIRDNGRGFPAAVATESDELPLSAAPWSIRERVEALGGTLHLTSKTGTGSELRITLPNTARA